MKNPFSASLQRHSANRFPFDKDMFEKIIPKLENFVLNRKLPTK